MKAGNTMLMMPLSEQDAERICSWRYPAPYEIFNWPKWNEMRDSGFEFGDPMVRALQYAAIRDDEDQLIGFAQFFPMSGVTRLGLGLRPDLCGNGLGTQFARFIAESALEREPANEIDLEVLTWNVRAIKAYERAGFVHTDTYERATPSGVKEFHCMVYQG